MVTLTNLPPEDPRWESALPVLRELRPHLDSVRLAAVLRDGPEQGLRFIGAFDSDRCVGVAGYRLIVNTSAGRKLYVDDLVVAKSLRSTGVGELLLDELISRARQLECSQVDLDSGVQRFAAHRFYLTHGFEIRSHHFTMSLAE